MAKIAFTFDDGIRTHYDLVRPLFKKHGLTGTFFIPGISGRSLWKFRMRGNVENDGADMQEGPLDWPEMVEMAEEGFELGNHTESHPRMTALSPDECLQQISAMEDQFREHGVAPSSSFCYPGYHANGKVASVLRAMGNFKFARIGYCARQIERGEPKGGNRPENREEVYYYIPGQTDPMYVPSTGILNDWYTVDHFIADVDGIPEGCVGVFTAHGFARKMRWDRFEEMVQYVIDNGHETVNFRDMSAGD